MMSIVFHGVLEVDSMGNGGFSCFFLGFPSIFNEFHMNLGEARRSWAFNSSWTSMVVPGARVRRRLAAGDNARRADGSGSSGTLQLP